MKKFLIVAIMIFTLSSCSNNDVSVDIYDSDISEDIELVQYRINTDSSLYNPEYPIYRKGYKDYVINENHEIIAIYGINDSAVLILFIVGILMGIGITLFFAD